jgi:hypothetical protein
VSWIVVVAAAAVLVLVLLGAYLLHARQARELEDERSRLEEARRTTAHLERRVATLRHELSEQHRTNAELTARLRTAGDARGAGLWVLERLRQSRLAGTPPLRAASGPGLDMAADLREAITLELELLREEVGTHAEIEDVALGPHVSAREALAVLRVVQELSATVAKRADELRVDVQRDGDAAIVKVTALGWPESPPHHGVLERGVNALQGSLDLRTDSGVLTVEVRIPDTAG